MSVALAADGWTVLESPIASDYEAAVAALAAPEHFPARDLKIVLTPMHGVGGATAAAVLNAAGFADVTLVAEQAQPDPDFPTVNFPNPEEPGALDLALETAARVGADIVIANDPDADRAAVAAKDPATGAWRMLRGDEVGALLGAHVVARQAPAAATREGVFANSIVSSRLLARIAAAAGYVHEETLTGFKWIARVPGLVYGYEEALGYCVAPSLVRDKDGIAAAVLIAELAAAAKAAGKTIFDTLDELYLVHGLHASDQLSIRVADLGLLDAMMNRLRVSPPESFGGSAVETSRTSPRAARTCRPPRDCCMWRRTSAASSSGPAAPSRSSSATWRSSAASARPRNCRQPGPRPAPPWTASSRTSARPWAYGVLELDLDVSAHDPGGERGEPEFRVPEAFTGGEVVDLLVQRGSHRWARPRGIR